MMTLIRRVFSLDLRSIALFRIMLAFLLLADLLIRSLDISTFYTDQGILPRTSWLNLSNRWQWSLHAASGELWWQVLLFVIAGVFALALLIGYRTRFAAFASFVLLASLQNRNGLLLQGGDNLLVVMSFWALFLPLAARYAVDSALQPGLRDNPNAYAARLQQNSTTDDLPRHDAQALREQPYFSVATIAIVFQILYLYIFTAFMKTGDAWIVRFDAAYYAVSLQHFATPIGDWISQFPQMLKAATFFVLSVEFIGPLLILCPFFWPWVRVSGLLLLGSLHVAFLLMLHIGLFPLIDFMALSLLIPGALWVKACRTPAQIQRREYQQAIRLYYDEDCGFCLKMCLILRAFLLPAATKILPAQHYPDIYPILERENSWVVTDPDGKPYIHWNAMAYLFSQRWPFKPLAWLMRLPPLMAIGNAVYGWVATHRGFMGVVTERLIPYRGLRLRPTVAGSVLAIFTFYIVTSFNVYGLRQVKQPMPAHVNQLARAAKLDQRWGMFAPFPLTLSSYVLIPGQLRNGEQVDLYPLTSSAPEWKPPELFYPLYDGYRWRKYLDRVGSDKNNEVRSALGNYFCQSWNGQPRARDTQLATLEIIYVRFRTNTLGEPKEESRKIAWRHWCFKEFANS
ncbi:DCC1-like thiol-disulfide oxidoreductase family protein [bacterium]|nr:DCC1-like thiol-disulfide oxidoreductase family protein [bacterium]